MARPSQAATTRSRPRYRDNVVRPAEFQIADAELVEASLGGDDRARRAIYARHAPHVRRVLLRCLGTRVALADAIQDVFEQGFRDLSKLRDRSALKAWLTRIAVYVARGRIRRKARRRWSFSKAPDELPEREAPVADEQVHAAMESLYAILGELDADERIAFVLRYVEGMELKEAAAACDCSLATIKRRLRRAEDHFVPRAKATATLRPWVEGGSRWT